MTTNDKLVNKDYNMLIPNNDIGMLLFKNRITYPGRSLQGFQTDTNNKYNFEYLEEHISKKNISIVSPTYIWCHTKFTIDVTSINTELKSKCNFGSLENNILVIPITRKIIPLSNIFHDILRILPDILTINNAEIIVKKYLLENNIRDISEKEILIKMEEEGIIRYSLNDRVKFHTDFIDGYYYDYYSNPIPHHQIKSPELDNFKISLTEKCNQLCTYCYYKENKEIERYNMTEDILKKTIHFIYRMAKYKKLKIVKISWWGGDPVYSAELLLKGLVLCEEVLESNNIIVKHSITSSFVDYYKNPLVIEAIKKYNIDVTISCDGYPSLHNKHRKLIDNRKFPFSSYDLMDKARIQIISNSYTFTEKCNFIENNQNLKNIDNIFKVKQRCTIYTLNELRNFNKLCNYFNTYNIQYRITFATHNRNLNDKKKFEEKINSQIIQAQKLLIKNYPKTLNNVKSIFLNMLTNPNDGINFCYSRCGFGGGVIIINTQGKIYSCHRFCDIDEFCLGSIEDTSQFIENNRKKLRKRWLCNFSPCNKCAKQSYCSGGGCAHEAYYYNGSIESNAGCISSQILMNKAILTYIYNMLYPFINRDVFCLEDASYARHCWYY